jgi:hypothetical protein
MLRAPSVAQMKAGIAKVRKASLAPARKKARPPPPDTVIHYLPQIHRPMNGGAGSPFGITDGIARSQVVVLLESVKLAKAAANENKPFALLAEVNLPTITPDRRSDTPTALADHPANASQAMKRFLGFVPRPNGEMIAESMSELEAFADGPGTLASIAKENPGLHELIVGISSFGAEAAFGAYAAAHPAELNGLEAIVQVATTPSRQKQLGRVYRKQVEELYRLKTGLELPVGRAWYDVGLLGTLLDDAKERNAMQEGLDYNSHRGDWAFYSLGKRMDAERKKNGKPPLTDGDKRRLRELIQDHIILRGREHVAVETARDFVSKGYTVAVVMGAMHALDTLSRRGVTIVENTRALAAAVDYLSVSKTELETRLRRQSRRNSTRDRLLFDE